MIKKQYIKSRQNKYIILWLVILWIIFGCNTLNPDYNIYSLIYNGNYPNHELGFLKLCQIFNLIGFEYQQFLMITAGFLMIGLYYCLRKYSLNPFFVLFLYSLFPFLRDCIVLRSFIAEIIIVISIKYLLNEKKGNTVKFILFVLLATSMHYSAFLFISLLLTKISINKKEMVAFLLIVLSGVAIMNETGLLQRIMLNINFSSKISSNFSSWTFFGFVESSLLHLFNTILFYFAYKKYIAYATEEATKQMSKRVAEIYLKINIIMLILLPLYRFTSGFFRIYRTILLIDYIFIGNVIILVNSKRWKSKNIFIFTYILFIMILSIIYILTSENIWKPFFENNLLFGN